VKLVSVSKGRGFNPASHWQFGTRPITNAGTFQEIITSFVWSPIIWKDGRRKKENFLTCNYMALDFDDGEMTLGGAESWCRDRGFAFIIGTSKSHQKEKVCKSGKRLPAVDRFRLVIPFAETIRNKDEYEYNMLLATETLPCDPKCKDAGRYFFPCKTITSVSQGNGYPVFELPKGHAKAAKESAALDAEKKAERKKSGTLPIWVITALRCGAQPGERNNTCYAVARELTDLGFSQSEIKNLLAASPAWDLPPDEMERAIESGANTHG
jgi:hypothetical protein